MPNLAGHLWAVFAQGNIPEVETRTGAPGLSKRGNLQFGYSAVFTHGLAFTGIDIQTAVNPPAFVFADSVPIEIAFAYGDDAVVNLAPHRTYAELEQPPYNPTNPFPFAIGYFGPVIF